MNRRRFTQKLASMVCFLLLLMVAGIRPEQPFPAVSQRFAVAGPLDNPAITPSS